MLHLEASAVYGTGIKTEVAQTLVSDFASDPIQCDKVLIKSNDPSWPLYSELCRLLESLGPEALEATYADSTFAGLYGKDEKLARAWYAERLLIEQAARKRLESLAESQPSACTLPYSADCLRGLRVDDECLIPLRNFTYNNSTLNANGFSFTVCPTNTSANSTYWLLRSFYEQGVSDHVKVRLDPFLWGPSDSFPQMMYKMIVYARPVNWDGIGRLREQHHGQMRADKSPERSELTEFVWDPRDGRIHFICEELPPIERIDFEAARYLHAIYDPDTSSIVHFDGALRIYTPEQLRTRHSKHLRNSGKMGLRRKIFRLDKPIDREAFSLIAQAFFVWNYDLATYFRETLPVNI
jgi:hypothetical protein